jgi:FixJ family two-component response regulator
MLKPAIRIAIVDDDVAVRKALTRLLSARALASETFASAGDFLNSLQNRRPDCLILDQQMPGMTGLELQIHLARQLVRIPTIVITAHDEEELCERCLSAGASAVLIKPLEVTKLMRAIECALAKSTS